MSIFQKKICMLGDFSVGKTSLVRRFVEDRFDETYLSTIGVKISRKTIQVEDNQIKLLLWDLAGGDDYNKMTSGYLKGAAGILMVCDLTRRLSFDAFNIYTRQLQEINLNPALVLVGNKSDLTNEIEISEDKLAAKSEALGAPYVITSAKTGENVDLLFQKLTSIILDGES